MKYFKIWSVFSVYCIVDVKIANSFDICKTAPPYPINKSWLLNIKKSYRLTALVRTTNCSLGQEQKKPFITVRGHKISIAASSPDLTQDMSAEGVCTKYLVNKCACFEDKLCLCFLGKLILLCAKL